VFVFNSNANPHGVDFCRIMEIDDLVAHHLVVWDIEINVIVRAQPGGTPVDLTHFRVGLADLQPVADLVGPIYLDCYASDDPGKEILPGKADDDRDDSRACQQSFQLRLGMIAVTQNEKQDDQENDSADDLSKKMRDCCLSFLFKV